MSWKKMLKDTVNGAAYFLAQFTYPGLRKVWRTDFIVYPSCSLIALIKYPQQKQLEEERADSGTGLRFIMVGTSWQQEPEAAGHIISPVRKQRTMNPETQLPLLFMRYRKGTSHLN